MIAFPRVLCMFIYIYIYMFVSLTQVCVVYVVKELMSFGGLDAAERKLLVALLAYVETGTNS